VRCDTEAEHLTRLVRGFTLTRGERKCFLQLRRRRDSIPELPLPVAPLFVRGARPRTKILASSWLRKHAVDLTAAVPI
jgi:hypothetical protein